ncbi:nucleotide exchange factor GrpE [bacterium]|nr:nucleotide exchange factor GrpE [bacterium]
MLNDDELKNAANASESSDSENVSNATGEALEKCKTERAEYLAGWQRAQADYANLERESARERDAEAERARIKIFRQIAEVLDGFERAFSDKESWNSAPESWRSGMTGIYEKTRAIFREHGVEEISPAKGDAFDPTLHDSMMIENTADQAKDGLISETMQKGYRINGRVVRPASVKIFSHTPESPSSP